MSKEQQDNLEIEVKYKVNSAAIELPKDYKDIEQFYTQITEEEEVRHRAVKDSVLRAKALKNKYINDESFYITIKKGNGLVREERELETTEVEYNEGKENIVGNIIRKRRYEIPYKVLGVSYLIELDVYKGSLEGLIVAEVECKSKLQVFILRMLKPSWFTEDITEDERYKNKNLSLNGLDKLQD